MDTPISSVPDWLDTLGLSEYADRFAANDIDVDVLPDLTDRDLEQLGISLGHRRRILRAVRHLGASAAARPQPGTASQPKPRDDAQRRQLTVMFTDLVGSTTLSTRLDPEDLRAVIGAYHRCVAETVDQFDGFVAKYMGDGVLVYFGYPKAHEEDAERALHCALAIAYLVPQLAVAHAEVLQVRIGIATGTVVVGDLIGSGEAQERGVVGETPNLAARLQTLAEPSQVVVSKSTRRLAGGIFEYRDMGAVTLKGFPEPMQAWQVLGVSTAESRFAARRETQLAPLIGRETELNLLASCWRNACNGEGRVALISGEPGIGKSRLTEALQGLVATTPHTLLRHFCSPHHIDSALFPVVTQIERAAGFKRTDAPSQKIDKLEALLGPSSAQDREEFALLSNLLLVPTDGPYRLPEMSPQDRKEKTLATILQRQERLARQRPLLLAYEDAHWADPTTRHLLDVTVERVTRSPTLMVVTSRPEFTPPWTNQPHVTSLVLNRLESSDGATLVEGVAGGRALSSAHLAEIVKRSDGIPLFIEELTKAVLEVGGGVLKRTAVPATLHDLLMARLDRLGPDVREIAQIGSAIGREFSYELLAQVAEKSDVELEALLNRFVEAGLVFRKGIPPEVTYLFKHALVRDAAYSTMLREQRQGLHRRIAAVLERDFKELVTARPELLAQHQAEAGEASPAIEKYLTAAKRATAASNNAESSEHLKKALTLLDTLPASDRRTTELRMRIEVGGWWWSA